MATITAPNQHYYTSYPAPAPTAMGHSSAPHDTYGGSNQSYQMQQQQCYEPHQQQPSTRHTNPRACKRQPQGPYTCLWVELPLELQQQQQAQLAATQAAAAASHHHQYASSTYAAHQAYFGLSGAGA